MTKSVCMICGGLKFGAWSTCSACNFEPRTALDLSRSLSFSESGSYADRLEELATYVKEQVQVLETGKGTFTVDRLVADHTRDFLENPGLRDVISLTRRAKSGLFKKQLNLHEISVDGIISSVLTRGQDIDRRTFDAIKSVGDGDLYVLTAHEGGEPQRSAIPKDRWYAMYDLMIIAERELRPRSKLAQIYDEFCQLFVTCYLEGRKVEIG